MTVLHNSIRRALSEKIFNAVAKTYPESELKKAEIYGQISVAPNLKMGHFAFPCFLLAKAAKSSPVQIATKLLENLPSDELVAKAVGQGPYLNFFITENALGGQYIEAIISGDFFKEKIIDDPDKVMIEYSQPNTHKILHVGHMRNLCLGNALVRMSRYAGEDVVAVTYPGDVGTHVAKCLWYLKFHNTETIPSEEKGEWLGTLYTKATLKLEEEKGSDKEELNRQQLTQILKELHDGNGEFYDLWKETKEWSVALMQEAYDWADVSFDRWFWESEVDAPSIRYANQLLAEGKLVKDQGAVGMDLSDDKLGFCLLIKSDGTGLYATKDVELAKKKFEEFGIDKNIYVVDNRQSHHFKQVFKVLEKLGFENASKCHHLQYEMVELPDGAMSSRKGNIVPLHELIQQMELKIKENYLNRYLEDSESGWSQDDVNKTATMVANGAIKYGMIRIDNNRKIVFDINEWTKLDGETGPYLQYVYARINSLCHKIGMSTLEGTKDWSILTKDQEVALMIKLGQFNSIVEQSVEGLKTMHLCSYLYELGKLFNSFYVECPIGKADNDELKKSRLGLAYATGEVMKQGLSILGIPAPEKM